MNGHCPLSPPGGWGLQKPPCGVSLNAGHPLSQGLLACYLLNEGAGRKVSNVVDDRTFGIITGASWQAAGGCTALFFNDNEHVECDAPVPGPGYGDYAIAAWVRITTTQPDESGGFRLAGIAGRGFYANTIGAGLSLSNERPSFQVRHYAAVGATATVTILDSQWHSMVGVLRRGGTPAVELWVDGRRAAWADASSLAGLDISPLPAYHWAIGSRHVEGDWRLDLVGHVASVAAWSRSLTPEEIRLLHTQPYCMF